MTDDDRVYGEWLNLLGSGLLDDSVLHTLHDRAEASHHAWGCTGGPGHKGDCPIPDAYGPGSDMDDYASAQADALRLGTEAG